MSITSSREDAYLIHQLGSNVNQFLAAFHNDASKWQELKSLQKSNPPRVGWFKASLQTVRTHTYTSMAQDLLLPTTLNAGYPLPYVVLMAGVFALNLRIATIEGFKKTFWPKETLLRICVVVSTVFSARIVVHMAWDVATLIVRLARLRSRIHENANKAQNSTHPAITFLSEFTFTQQRPDQVPFIEDSPSSNNPPANEPTDRPSETELPFRRWESFFVSKLDRENKIQENETVRFDLIELPDSYELSDAAFWSTLVEVQTNLKGKQS